MADAMVIAGTSDAKQIINKLLKKDISVIATVATGYGSQLLERHPKLQVHEGRLSEAKIANLLVKSKVKCLIDASHPFAKEISVNSMKACIAAKIPYLRFERNGIAASEKEKVVHVDDFLQAARKAALMEGNILLTIGSNNVEVFTANIPDYKRRLFVRVLPESGVLAKCEAAGLNASNIIAMKGPFSEEMNYEMIRYCDARVLVTKDSGNAGGVEDKLKAARKAGIDVILIKRPYIQYGYIVSTIDGTIEYVEKHI
ncbi:cobalt-precorrin-6A reductase [Lutispora thermophila]|uniref:Precorrin-6A/cobalt-precorrin-6A reductase n=1 Tax=Lutispora thermophila DSM 19022 TaxID=1122184 RepID=A0A1M6D3I8_9FIRM|nr:cobalt-precorrin-6A reductase [Lutispora thermophila]SHI67865.1 precorrin-6A/cobalt-precorrin-6A reductase [Lutispora thermophila DSM 19022]